LVLGARPLEFDELPGFWGLGGKTRFLVREHEKKAGKQTGQADGKFLFGDGQRTDTNSVLVKDNDSPAIQVCV
jgi:hypothetical protein